MTEALRVENVAKRFGASSIAYRPSANRSLPARAPARVAGGLIDGWSILTRQRDFFHRPVFPSPRHDFPSLDTSLDTSTRARPPSR